MPLNTFSKYASLVKFPHTIFALPFALIGYFYGVQTAGFSWVLLCKVLICMVLARNAAMGFNRWADRKIDAENPRTAGREIPRGVISSKNALRFSVLNGVLFVAAALWIDPLCGALAPVALAIIGGYSFTKRFTGLSHLVLGLALAIAPIGAYLAVTETFTRDILMLSALVLTWTAGFDILYSLQDIDFDRARGLHSLPARLGVRGALWASATLHFLTFCIVLVLHGVWGQNLWAQLGEGLFLVLLVFQHIIVSPRKLSRIGLAFGTLNGVASIVYATGVILGFYIS